MGVGCRVNVDGSRKFFKLRLSLPFHLQPGRRWLRDLAASFSPQLIDYTICFGGAFAGLAYGLEDNSR